jgi:hypothetical protein
MTKRRTLRTTLLAPGSVMHFDGDDLFIIINGVRVAKRGHPGTPEARTWIPLDPRFVAHGDWDWSYRSDSARVH